MQTLKLSLRPRSAFGTPLAGDTLFGQICWALRLRRSEAGLTELLDGYTQGRPFAVLSDAFPAGLLPRPAVPEARLGRTLDPKRRKEEKRRVWLPAASAHLPLTDWLGLALKQDESGSRPMTEVLTQNTINRLTGTTGEGLFAPRQVEQIVYAADTTLDVYVALDGTRLETAALREALEDIGASGYGRDASTGLGKFDVLALEPHVWPRAGGTQAITLAPCAPQPERLDANACFYQPLTRFGRHGNIAVHGEAGPFKRPILMLRTAALLTLRESGVPAFHGTGLGGTAQPISGVIPATVHQGYAPLVPVNASLQAEAA